LCVHIHVCMYIYIHIFIYVYSYTMPKPVSRQSSTLLGKEFRFLEFPSKLKCVLQCVVLQCWAKRFNV